MSFCESLPERRRAPRIALQLEASLQNPSGKRAPIKIIDISPYGCRVECPSPPTLHSNVWLYLAALDAQYMRVVWHSDTFAGLEFGVPLQDAVFENLLAAKSDMVTSTMADLYQVALRSRDHAARTSQASTTEALNDLARDCAAAVLHQLLNNTVHNDLPSQLSLSVKMGLV